MSVRASRTRLLGMMKDLQLLWDQTKHQWNDPVSKEVEKQYLVPLERNLKNAVNAMENMSLMLAKARRECE